MIGRQAPSFLLLIVALCAVGCADNYYRDEKLKMEVQQLDSDLENKWSTTGVIVIKVDENGPADRAGLEWGELISYALGERKIESDDDFNDASKQAMKDDNNFIAKLGDGRTIRLAVRREGDKVGLKVDGNRVVSIAPGSPADTGNIKVGDIIESVIDERNITSIKAYKEAIRDISKHASGVTFRTTELVGIKIAAVSAQGNLADVRAVDPLTKILETPGSPLREPAAQGLERLVALSQLNDMLQQFQAVNADELPASQLNPRKRSAAEILGLLTVDLEANRATLNAPFGTQFRHRSQALYERIVDGRMVELARKYINRNAESNQNIRRYCLSILENLQSPAVIPELIAVVEDSGEIPGVRFKAGLALSRIGEPAVDALVTSFQSGDASVKDITASALGTIGGNKARNTLIDALRTIEDPTVKLTVADAIGKIGDEASKQALQNQRAQLPQDSGLAMFLNELLKQLETETM